MLVMARLRSQHGIEWYIRGRGKDRQCYSRNPAGVAIVYGKVMLQVAV